MTNYILAFILFCLALAGVIVKKNYYELPPHELKRRAAKHDPGAQELYRAVGYGNSLRILLWLYIGLTTAASVVLLARQLPLWASLLAALIILWLAFALLPSARYGGFGKRLALAVTPAVAWLLNYLHPVLGRAADLAEHSFSGPQHTHLFEREDVLKLIERQQWQADSRLSDEELEIAKRALTFGDRQVVDVLVPRKAVKTVLAKDTIGPVLINELHESQQDYALVREKAKGAPAGILDVRRLGLYSSGLVSDCMDDTVYYLHENDSLSEALHAFFVTNKPVFVVINSFEEYVGLVTVENILRELLGHVPGDDFNQYADPSVVAARHTRPAAAAAAEAPVKTAEEMVE